MITLPTGDFAFSSPRQIASKALHHVDVAQAAAVLLPHRIVALSRRGHSVGLWLAEETIEFGLGAGIAGRRQSCALPLPLVTPFQSLAQFLGRLASHRRLDHAAQARRPRGFRDPGSGHGAKLLAGGRRQILGRNDRTLSRRQSIRRGTEIPDAPDAEAANGLLTMATMLGIMPRNVVPAGNRSTGAGGPQGWQRE